RAGGGAGTACARARARRAHLPPSRASAARPPCGESARMKRIAIVPAYDEEDAIGHVIDELRAAAPDLDVLVVDDGSHDRTAAVARSRGARVVRLPFNLGIGGSVQTGFRYAAEHGY